MLYLNSERKRCYLNGSKMKLSVTPVPPAYEQLDHLIFDGDSFINTGVLSFDDIGALVTFSTTTIQKWLFGCRVNSNISGFLCGIFATAPRGYAAYGGATASNVLSVTPLDGRKHTVLLDPVHYQLDGVEQTITRGTFQYSRGIYLGSIGIATDLRNFVGEVYSFRLFSYSTGKDLFNGFPVKRRSDNVYGLYDSVSGQFFTNSGTGTITGA